MTTTIQYTRDQLLTASLRKLGVLAQGQTPSAEDIANAAMALNTAIAELRVIGMPLWARNEYTFIPTTGEYTIGLGYTLNTPYPLHLLDAYRLDTTTKIPIIVESLQSFNRLPLTTGSAPLKVTYTPKINYGVLKFWPTPDSTNTSSVTLTYQQPFEYFTTSTDVMQFPEEWYNALIYKTAVLIAPEWGIPLQDRKALQAEAAEYITNALGNEQEDGSVYFYPNRMF